MNMRKEVLARATKTFPRPRCHPLHPNNLQWKQNKHREEQALQEARQAAADAEARAAREARVKLLMAMRGAPKLIFLILFPSHILSRFRFECEDLSARGIQNPRLCKRNILLQVKFRSHEAKITSFQIHSSSSRIPNCISWGRLTRATSGVR
jgi:hypothetical protein